MLHYPFSGNVWLAALVLWLALSPSPAPAHGPFHERLASVERLIAADPEDPVPYLERAELHRAHGDFAKAEADYRRARARGGDEVTICFAEGRMLVEADCAPEAISLLAIYTERRPLAAHGHLWLARAHRAVGDLGPAVRSFDLAIALAPRTTPDLHLERAEAQVDAGEPEDAARGLKAAIDELGPIVTLVSRAVDLDVEGRRFDRALAHVGAFLAENPTATSWHARRAEILEATGRGVAVRDAYTKSLKRLAEVPAPRRSLRAGALDERAGGGPDLAQDRGPDSLLVRGPYIQNTTTTSATIRWRTSMLQDSRVLWGDAPGNLMASIEIPGDRTDHAIEITGLTKDTITYYAIGSSSEILAGDEADHYFVTLQDASTSRPTRVWLIGDSGTADSSAAAVRDAYFLYTGSVHTDAWIMLGDNAYEDGTESEYQAAVFDMYPTILRNTSLWSTLGNHDGRSADSATETGPYYEIFTLPKDGEAGGLPSGSEAYYSFEVGDIHFICLDSHETDRSPGGAMLQWLEQDLLSTQREWIIAFWHHPPYSKGSHDSDVDTESIEMRENALPILEAGGVDLVVCGHSHSYERSFLIDGHYGFSSTLDSSMVLDGSDGREGSDGAYTKPGNQSSREGAVYAVAGSSAKTSGGTFDHPVMFLGLNELGSLVLDVDGPRLDAVFLDAASQVRDSFTMIHDPATASTDGPIAQVTAVSRVVGVHPNPFNPRMIVTFDVVGTGAVTLDVYAADGSRVRRLVAGAFTEGRYVAEWDGRNDAGRPAASGVYVVNLRTASGGDQRKTVLLR